MLKINFGAVLMNVLAHISVSVVCIILSILAQQTVSIATTDTYRHEVLSIENQIRLLITNKLETSDVEIFLEPVSDGLRVNTKAMEITGIELVSLTPSRFKIKVNFIDDTTELSGRYTAYKNIVVTTRFIKTKEVIKPGDIENKRVKIDKAPHGAILNDQDIIGKEAKKNLSVNTAVKIGDIITPYLVHENDEVSIAYISDNIMLQTNGIAISSGNVGDNVKVKNSKTGAIVIGIVIAKNMVQVNNEQ